MWFRITDGGRPATVNCFTAAYAAQHGLPSADPAALCEDPGVQAIVEAAVARANSQLSRIEQIKRFRILPVDWSPPATSSPRR